MAASKVFVSVDVRGGIVATDGWTEATEVRAREAIERWSLGKGGGKRFVFTNVDHDGMLDGANREEVARVAQAAR